MSLCRPLEWVPDRGLELLGLYTVRSPGFFGVFLSRGFPPSVDPAVPELQPRGPCVKNHCYGEKGYKQNKSRSKDGQKSRLRTVGSFVAGCHKSQRQNDGQDHKEPVPPPHHTSGRSFQRNQKRPLPSPRSDGRPVTAGVLLESLRQTGVGIDQIAAHIPASAIYPLKFHSRYQRRGFQPRPQVLNTSRFFGDGL